MIAARFSISEIPGAAIFVPGTFFKGLLIKLSISASDQVMPEDFIAPEY